MAGLPRPGPRGNSGSSTDLSSVKTYGHSDDGLWLALPRGGSPADLTAAPDALVDKIKARGETIVGDTFEFGAISRRIEDRKETRHGLFLVALVAAGIWGGVDALTMPRENTPADVVAAHNTVVAGCAVLVGVVWVVCALIAGWTYLRGRSDYGPEEVDALTAAQVQWPLSHWDLRPYPNYEVLEKEWDVVRPTSGGGAALVWREPRLVAVAYALLKEIEASAVWRNNEIINQQVREQIYQARDDINIRAYRIWRVHAETPNVAATQQVRDAARQAWPVLVQKVAELADYRSKVLAVAELYKEYQRLVAAAAPDGGRSEKLLNALTGDVHSDSIKAELPGAATDTRGDLELVRGDLQAQIQYLATSPLLRGISEPPLVQPPVKG